MTPSGAFVLAAVAFTLYFIPTGCALLVGKRNVGAIFILNLFLGWTFLGWVVALIWAFLHDAPGSKSGPGVALRSFDQEMAERRARKHP